MAEEGAVAVCVRVRPLNSREESLGETAQVYWKTDNNVIYQVDGSKSFNFDRVFHGNETTKNVYEEIAAPIIDSAIQGYNGTIFAYGQTASGKTYTMMGSEDHLGVIPRAIHDIFQKIKKFPDREFLLRVSYMEIYNETITDLLCGTQKMKPLIIREDVNRNVYVADLTEEVVYTSEMALKWITKGEKSRHYGETKMNQRSSRSHTIFRMILESREKGEPSNCEGSVKVSHLNLVDLAGSERAAQTGAAGVRLKEGCNINRSLFILGQVIKKLSDGQVGGFINYRDSKLTRILQNSLGGNAKTRIICTITPVSFDETLTALQFASTAKYMKNTPYVNEVSTDEALLKRYRKEIMDLKKQLEEVSLETRAQAMEKDQLAQLLEEKDLLQKVQNEKIENLTRMLVTSSSLTLQQELKAKRKRRVTWCLGKINKMKNSNYADQFNIPTNITTKTHKLSINLLREIDESVCSESDVFSNTLDTLSEIEWNPATKLLNQENIESELNSLRADYDNLVLDYEQLRTEKEEMELKLKEKNDLDEFEALERKTKKDQEMQLIHEISNLKNLVKHAEVYNQDLENELSSKVELLREKEDQIKKLQEYIDSQKLENIKMDLSYSLESIEDPKQMKQTLFDAETVALDAKRESAFLRSENLELKEKMKELATTYKQMENDIQLYQSQLEAKKKMQVDLEKELQSAFNEITKLTSLIDGKVPKDLLCNLELEGKITDLQKELNKEVEENEALREEVILLSELKSLPSEVERLRKEIQDKSEELHIITSEKDKLFSEVVHKESRVQGLLEEIGKTKDDLATTQSNYKSTDQEFQNFKTLHMDFEQKYKMVLEENERMNQEIVNLSKEAQKFDSSLGALKTELSYKTQELQEKTREVQERLNEMEQLKEQLENRDSTLQTVEREKTLITEKLQQTLEEVKTLTQEKDDLKQLQESLQIERDQLKSDIHDTVNMNIDTQEQLRNALESLKQHQETINTLKSKISEEVSRNLHMEENTGETKDEFQQKMVGIDKKQDLEAKNTQTLTADVKDNEIIEQQRKIFSLIQEKNELQQMLESVIAEKEQLKTDLKENIEMTIENQEELRLLGDELKKQQEIVAQEKNHAIKKEGELSRTCDRLAEVEEKLKEKSQQLQEKQQQLLNVQEEMSEMQKKINEIENLKNELKNKELTLEHMETERLELAQKLNENYEEVKSITKERKVLKELQKSFETERDHLRGYIREIEATGLQTKEELKIAHIHLKEHQETIDELRRSVSEKTAQIINTQDLEKSHTKLQEEIPVLHEEQELLPNVKEVSETQETMNELELLTEQSTTKDSTTLARIEMERLRLNEKFQESQEEIKSLTKERDNLKTIKEALEVKHDQLKEHIRETLAKIQESQSKQEQSLNMKEKDNETTKIVSEMEQFKPKDSALLRIEIEMLGLSKRLQESHDEMKSVAKEKDDLQRLQEVLQSESDQLKENIKEIVAKMKESQEKEYQFLKMTAVNETQEKMCEIEHLKEQFETQKLNLENIETENIRLTQILHENLEEMRSVTKERDDLRSVEETLKVERDQLKENLRETITRDLEKQEELKIVHMHLKEHQETIDKLRGIVSEKTNEISNMQKDLEHSNDALKAQDLKIQEELRIAHMHLKEQQETIDKLRGIVSEKTDKLSNMQKDLENSNAKLQEKIQELKANEHQLITLKKDVNETQKKVSEMEQLKKQIKDQSLTLSKLEIENLNLAQKLHENLEEMKSVMKERDNLRRVEETLKLERDQLKESLQETKARDLEIQQELKTARMLSKEHKETVDKLREKISEKTIQISDIQKDLDKSKDELQKKIQELQKKELQLLRVKEDVNMSHKKINEMEQLKKQFEAQNLSMQSVRMDNFQLTKKLHESLEEIRIVAKERDELRRIKESLKMERDQFIATLREMIARDRQNHQVKPEKRLLSDGQQHLTESLREKCSRIKELLKRYSEMDDHYECLNRLSLDLEKEIEFQKELSMRVKANLSLPYLQTKHIEKLFTANQRCSMEFHRIMKKLKYVLSYVTKIKEEQHESINKFEMDFIDEVEKQKELLIKIQHLQQDCDVPSRELRDLKLNQNMDLHIEEILKDFSESEFPSIKTEFQQVLSNRKEMTQFLEEWLNTRFDIEKLKNGIQKENDRICQVNNFFNNRIIAIMNESTEFEERSATISKEWEQDLKSLKEKNEKLFKNYQTLKTSLASGAQVNPTTQDNKNPHVTSRATQLTTEKIRELENSLHEAKESAMHKESKIIKMQKELEVTNDIIAKLQAKVHESNKCLEKTKETIQVLQDKVALGAKPYKEEIEDLKMKLVKIDLEKMKNAKEFEKEISATKATVEYQKEVIRLLRENLRRSQQAQDTSVISEHTDPQPSNKPLTCGGGSGIVQNTKALILKSEHIRLEKEISKLKQQNEQLIKQKNELLSNNQHLSNEVKTWKERTLKREAHKQVTCENSPKSPKVTGTASKKKQITPSQCKERNLQDPVPKESPKSCFFDSRSKSLPSPHPVRYFDNSSLGLCPEVQNAGAESVDSQPGPWHASSGKDVPECKTQ
ncbi:centromere-associated protein E isoform X10 [Homo sapiens]|uniref:centromere-associated protein E isoform X10 n=1 Tax=Homo sapiens TaxID=9606 RepID=UPI0005D00CF7|nr:centromere-associated protein E isoform X10 [Homo sapiens]XP_054204762.1 centromere-associated protein E isoform X10 [Homo sapiens]|eukprot:XP_011529851.1 centromere-associated protein E isoform X6 [Homo sapiens]